MTPEEEIRILKESLLETLFPLYLMARFRSNLGFHPGAIDEAKAALEKAKKALGIP